jgi:hypothetical protein
MPLEVHRIKGMPRSPRVRREDQPMTARRYRWPREGHWLDAVKRNPSYEEAFMLHSDRYEPHPVGSGVPPSDGENVLGRCDSTTAPYATSHDH